MFEVAPPIAITTGSDSALGVPARASTLTGYTPTVPGVSQENSACAGIPSIVTVGVVVVSESKSGEVGDPLGWLATNAAAQKRPDFWIGSLSKPSWYTSG